MVCTFAGNSDVFGIGIRTGYYSQILAIWLSNHFYAHDAGALRAINLLLLIALVVAGLTYFALTASTFVIEAFLLLQIGLVVGILGVTEGGRSSSKFQDVSAGRLVFRIAVFVFGTFFNLLFWWKGLDLMIPTPCNGVSDKGVGTYVFYGWRVSIYGWLRVVMKVSSVFVTVWTTPMHVSQDTVLLCCKWMHREAQYRFISAASRGADGRYPESGTGKVSQKGQILKGGERNVDGLGATGGGSVTSTMTNASLSPDKQLKETVRQVQRAQQYLKGLFDMFETFEIPASRKSYCFGLVKSTRSARKETTCTDTTAYPTCVWHCFCMTFDMSTLGVRWVLAYYFTRLGQHSILHWPRILHRLHERAKDAPSWQYLLIASDLKLSQTLPTSTKLWAIEAGVQLLIFCLLVVQVELTIQWNHITGLNALTPLGQLIPFVIGVASLIRMIWCISLSRCGRQKIQLRHRTSYEAALEAYMVLDRSLNSTERTMTWVRRATTA